MRGFLGRPLPPAVWEILAACLLLAWRLSSYPTAGLWRDWVVLLCVFWIFCALAGRTKAAPAVMGLLMAFLFALYAVHQVPLSLAVLGSLR